MGKVDMCMHVGFLPFILYSLIKLVFPGVHMKAAVVSACICITYFNYSELPGCLSLSLSLCSYVIVLSSRFFFVFLPVVVAN